MTVNPITLDLHDFSQIMSPNIANIQTMPCINVNVSVGNICAWITSKGGWQAIATYDIMTLVDAYLQLTNLGYTVRMQDINGAIAYYLNIPTSGNTSTGCAFP
jgi:hypothetical protein